MGRLVGRGELGTHLQRPVREDSEALAIRVAEGWLRSVCTRLPDWPDPVPEDLWAWALELTVIAYENPRGLASRTVGEDTQAWAIARKQQILDAAEGKYGGTQPEYHFPPAPCWPT